MEGNGGGGETGHNSLSVLFVESRRFLSMVDVHVVIELPRALTFCVYFHIRAIIRFGFNSFVPNSVTG